MKRYLVLLIAVLLLCGSLFCGYADSEPETITVAFFNALRFGHGGQHCKGDLSLFARILSGYDIIGFAEVMKNTGTCDTYPEGGLGHLDTLKTTLEQETSISWNYVVSPYPQPKTQNYKEYYAVFYNQRVQCCDQGCFLPDSTDRFVRDPYYASFRSGNFDFTVVLFHASWDSDAREVEISSLKDAYESIQNLDPYENDIILMGDFNVPSSSSELWEELTSICSMKRLIDESTTLSTEDGLTGNSYDTIWIQSHYTGQEHEFTGEAGAYPFRNLSQKDQLAYRTEVSDHLPVWATFSIDKDDDDPSKLTNW